MAEEPLIFECNDLVEFREEAVLAGAPKGVFVVRIVHVQLETRVILYLTLQPNPTFNGHRVDQIPVNMLRKANTPAV